jgi:hypothetical protein
MQIRKATKEDREAVIELLRTLLIPAGEALEGYPLYLRHGFEDHGKIQVKADLPLSGR